MTIHNSSVYKIGKVVLKEGPEVVAILDDFYAKLSKYSVLRDVRLLMIKIKETKQELNYVIDSAKKIVDNKGRIGK